MKKLIASAFLVAFCAFPAFAQTPSPSLDPDPAKVAIGRDIFDLVASKENLQSRLAAMQQAISQAVIQAAPQNQASRAQANAGAVMSGLNQVMQDMLPEYRELYAKAYAQHFSLKELRGIKAFYESPTGKKLTAETPEIARDALQVILPKMMARILALRGASTSSPSTPPPPGPTAPPVSGAGQ
jgi:hypothetical protein